jgi:hypothetical protein
VPLPSLDHWDTTAHSLQKVGLLLGGLRRLRLDPMPNFLHLGMKIVLDGLSTDVLPGGAEVIADFRRSALAVRQAGGERMIPFAGHSQKSLLDALLVELKTGELAGALPNDRREGSLVDQFLGAVAAKTNRPSSQFAYLVDETVLEVDAELAKRYAETLYRVFTGVARFRAWLAGTMTPVVVWPEHFDLSFLWFAGETADENAPHLNFGFAPFSAGIDFPYLYAYAYPTPKGDDSKAILPKLPAPAYWNTEGWTGVVLPYAKIACADEPEQYVEAMCTAIYQALLPYVTETSID